MFYKKLNFLYTDDTRILLFRPSYIQNGYYKILFMLDYWYKL